MSFRLLLFLLLTSFGFSQDRIPPPPCYANDNMGAGGVIGNGHFLHSFSETTFEFHFAVYSTEGLNDILVIYLDTGAPGRNIIDNTIDDAGDAYRVAITNSDVSGLGSTISFPPGFEAAYAIAFDTNSAGLYGIPDSGNVETGGLNYISPVTSTLISSDQGFFDIGFNLSDIGITSNEGFYFVAVYVGADGYIYDEGYGDGIVPGTTGADDVIFSLPRYIYNNPGCLNFLSAHESIQNFIDAEFMDNELYVRGINDEVIIEVYDIPGRKTFDKRLLIQEEAKIPLNLTANQLQFIVIRTDNSRKILKVIPR